MVFARDYLLIETEKLLSTELNKSPLAFKGKNLSNPASLVYFSLAVMSILMICVFGVHIIGWPPYIGIGMYMIFCGCFLALCRKMTNMQPERMASVSHIMSRVLFPNSFRVSFVEVIVADIFTSLSRILADGALAMMLVSCMWAGWNPPGEYCRGVLMALTACIPLVLRIRQCLILQKNSPMQYSKIHILNVIKYLSAVPVAWLSFTSQGPILSNLLTYKQRRFLSLLCIIFNTLFCISWDVLMDWGLMQKGASGLRHEPLLMPYRWMYYLAMFLNAAGRCMWSVRWLHIFHASFSSPVDSVLMLELAEVARRALWTVFRIEWEYVRPKMELLASHDSTTEL